jgi:hypothetical protein
MSFFPVSTDPHIKLETQRCCKECLVIIVNLILSFSIYINDSHSYQGKGNHVNNASSTTENRWH